jgi:menaquinone-dependent protoporphyrinogen IX oxidase
VNVLVTYSSRSGNTERAAEYIGGAFASRGHDVLVRPWDGLDYAEVAAADLVCVGTWVHGLFVIGQHAADTDRLAKMPMLWDKPVAAFMTYALNAGRAIDDMAEFLETEMGAQVIAGQSMRRTQVADLADGFVDDVLARIKVKA